MANYLDANPSELPTLERHRSDSSGQFIPTASGARFGALVNARSLTRGTCPTYVGGQGDDCEDTSPEWSGPALQRRFRRGKAPA